MFRKKDDKPAFPLTCIWGLFWHFYMTYFFSLLHNKKLLRSTISLHKNAENHAMFTKERFLVSIILFETLFLQLIR
jgi:hypothetical protein